MNIDEFIKFLADKYLFDTRYVCEKNAKWFVLSVSDTYLGKSLVLEFDRYGLTECKYSFGGIDAKYFLNQIESFGETKIDYDYYNNRKSEILVELEKINKILEN